MGRETTDNDVTVHKENVQWPMKFSNYKRGEGGQRLKYSSKEEEESLRGSWCERGL